LRLATIYSLQGEIDLLKPLVLSIDDFEDQSLDFKIQLCAFIIQCKKALKAIEILYQVRRENYSNGRVHLAYFQMFIKVEEEIVKKFLDKETVEFDTTVKLYNSDNDQTLSKTVLNGSNVRSYQNEIGLDHQLTSDLLGKKIGDKVIDSNGVSLEIVGISHKYVSAQQESMQLLENQFQDISGFQSFKLKRAPGEEPDFERDLAPMLKIIDEDKLFFDQLENQYKNGLPLGTFASFSKRNPIKVWSNFIQVGSPGIHHFGNNLEHNYGMSLIASGVDLAFSPSAILSSYVVLKEKLTNIKNKLFVPQSFINELNELIAELEESLQKGGFLTVFKRNGQYLRENITPEQLKVNVQYYSDLKKWIEEIFVIQPNYDEIKIEKEEKDRLDGLFGESFIDGAFIAKAKKGVLIADDANFRCIAKRVYNINGVGIYSLIRSLRDQNIIPEEEESKILYDLACINYNLIPPSVNLLSYTLNELKFQLKYPLTNLLDSLGSQFFEVNISIDILVQFLKQVYLERGDLVFQKVADYVIKVVMRRNPYPHAKMIFFNLIDIHFQLLVIQRQTIYSIWKTYENV
jgi:transcription elongation GreA/GreB family factor